MRVAALTDTDEPSDIGVQHRTDPTPGAGEAVVRVEAASLNHRDLWTLADDDRLADDDLPFVPGRSQIWKLSAVCWSQETVIATFGTDKTDRSRFEGTPETIVVGP